MVVCKSVSCGPGKGQDSEGFRVELVRAASYSTSSFKVEGATLKGLAQMRTGVDASWLADVNSKALLRRTAAGNAVVGRGLGGGGHGCAQTALDTFAFHTSRFVCAAAHSHASIAATTSAARTSISLRAAGDAMPMYAAAGPISGTCEPMRGFGVPGFMVSWFKFMVHSSWFIVHGSWYEVFVFVAHAR
eukprot:365119-Chlamydomonas_euryale.AAC.13